MRARIVGSAAAEWGLLSSGTLTAICLCLWPVPEARADAATIPDPPPRRGPPVVGPSRMPPAASLDGLHVWLGPVGAASHVEGAWDSTFGADLSIVRVREGSRLGAIGVTGGASRWTARGGGRIWLDGVAGTRLGGRLYGASIGPIVELAELAHPRLGGSVGLWAFFGVTPFARVGVIEDLGAFAEVGLHLALPVFRRR